MNTVDSRLAPDQNLEEDTFDSRDLPNLPAKNLTSCFLCSDSMGEGKEEEKGGGWG